MAKALSIASWNVERFSGDPARVDRVVAFLTEQDPDVFALYEVLGKSVFAALVQQMPQYSFHITEGPQTQEILVGARGSLTSFFTQRVEFKTGITSLRPGALLTVKSADQEYCVLFLHTKSSSKPFGLGIRDDMFERAFRFRKTLEKSAHKSRTTDCLNYIFLGDLNTMGMRYPFERSIDAPIELRKLDATAQKAAMRRLTKTRKATWFGGTQSKYPPSDIDHVVAANHLRFTQFAGAGDATGEVDVRGWPTAADPDQWIKEYSDHGLLYFEIERA